MMAHKVKHENYDGEGDHFIYRLCVCVSVGGCSKALTYTCSIFVDP